MTADVAGKENTRPRCPECKFRIRGKNHENGDHHKGTVQKCSKKKWR